MFIAQSARSRSKSQKLFLVGRFDVCFSLHLSLFVNFFFAKWRRIPVEIPKQSNQAEMQQRRIVHRMEWYIYTKKRKNNDAETNFIVGNLEKWMFGLNVMLDRSMLAQDVAFSMSHTRQIFLWNLKSIWNFRNWMIEQKERAPTTQLFAMDFPVTGLLTSWRFYTVYSRLRCALFNTSKRNFYDCRWFNVFPSVATHTFHSLCCGIVHFIAAVLITNKFRFNFLALVPESGNLNNNLNTFLPVINVNSLKIADENGGASVWKRALSIEYVFVVSRFDY